MEIRAYNEDYLHYAQNILGHAADFSIMTLGIDPDVFGCAFAVSDASGQFAAGNPRYVAGINGCELARIVLDETHTPYTDTEDVMYQDKSPEYWAGWALAFCQWYTSLSFMDILSAVPFSEMIDMYPAYHEMDISHFIDHIESVIRASAVHSRLKNIRLRSGLSQAELARDANVALRQIQLFEQRQRDINKAAAVTLLRLSRSLHCRVEDLLEYYE